MSTKKISFSGMILSALLLAGLISFGPAQARAADKVLTKAQVEDIVHDYINSHPQLIMDSVNAYRTKEMEAQQKIMSEKASKNVKKSQGELVKSESPIAGNPKGDVTVVEFFDYNCHFCKGAFPTVQSLLKDDKNVRFVFKDFPILGPSSLEAAKWALAAQKQDKYFAFHTEMMLNKEPITDALLESVAKKVGMDVTQAEKDAVSPEVMAQINKNEDLAHTLGIGGTPSFVIGDNVSPGAISEADMEQQIKAARDANAKK